MKHNWLTKKLDEVCDLVSRGVSPKYVSSGGILILNQKCIRNHEIGYGEAKRQNKNFSDKKLLQIGDVLVNSTGVGTLGRVAQVKNLNEPTLVDSHITIVRPVKNIFDTDFFGWAMIFVEELIQEMGAGASGQTELSRTDLKEIQIKFPESFSEQRRIVALLDEIFSATKKAKENTEKNLKNSQELFESYLESFFGNPGNDWQEKRFEECFRLKSGDSLTSKMMGKDGIYPVYGGNGIAGLHDHYNLSTNNIIIGRVGALCGNVRFITENIWLTDNAFKIVDFKFEFDYSFLTYLLNFKSLRSYARQAAQPVISNSSLKNVLLQFPKSLTEQKQIVAKLDALSVETKKLEEIYKKKLADLEELKKSVLKKAFNGEL